MCRDLNKNQCNLLDSQSSSETTMGQGKPLLWLKLLDVQLEQLNILCSCFGRYLRASDGITDLFAWINRKACCFARRNYQKYQLHVEIQILRNQSINQSNNKFACDAKGSVRKSKLSTTENKTLHSEWKQKPCILTSANKCLLMRNQSAVRKEYLLWPYQGWSPRGKQRLLNVLQQTRTESW